MLTSLVGRDYTPDYPTRIVTLSDHNLNPASSRCNLTVTIIFLDRSPQFPYNSRLHIMRWPHL